MLVTSSQSSTQRPLGLSVEELFALDRQYRRLEQQQQQQHLAQLQAQAHLTSSNLNRLASRSLDLVSSSPSTPLTILPSLEVHGRGFVQRPHISHPSTSHYPRSHSIDQLRYAPPPPVRHNYQHRFTPNDVSHHHQSRHRSYLQHPVMATGSTSSFGVMYEPVPPPPPPPPGDNYDPRISCKLRRQQPIKRESSRRIVVRPVIQRRREPSISSSCESLDELRSPVHRPSIHQLSDISTFPVPFTPSASLIADVIADLNDGDNRNFLKDDSFSDESDMNLYEMRLSIGKTYDTSDISVQLEGPKILIHCHTIEPTDKRGNYRKHEFKTELLVPDVVDDETIVAYLTEDGELIVEGKYQPWAWKEIKKTRQIEQKTASSPPSSSPVPPPILSPPNSASTSTRNDGGAKQGRISPSLTFNNSRMINTTATTTSRIETLDNNRTVIHVGESTQPPPPSSDVKSVSDIVSRFNTMNTPTLYDGQYSFTNDVPSVLIYHLRLPFETLLDAVRVQSDPQSNSLKILIEQQEKSSSQQEQNKIVIRSTSRLCRLPRDRSYDYARLRVLFLKDNFIRIELPTLF